MLLKMITNSNMPKSCAILFYINKWSDIFNSFIPFIFFFVKTQKKYVFYNFTGGVRTARKIMPNSYKRKPGARPSMTVSKEDLQKAIDLVKNKKSSIRAAAKKFGLKKSMLHFHARGYSLENYSNNCR